MESNNKTHHILIVEDEARSRKTLELFLRGKEYRVSSAKNGRDALNIIGSELAGYHPVDLVISDIQMPDMTGLEMVKILQSWHLSLPVLITTAFGDKETVVELLRAGCVDYLDKPYDIEELVQKVESILSEEKIDSQDEINSAISIRPNSEMRDLLDGDWGKSLPQRDG